MENQFIPYQQALELKRLGFNEPCVASYSVEGRFDICEQNGIGWLTRTNSGLEKYPTACAAPLYQQAFKWFRDQYGYTYSIGRTNICVYHLMVQGTLLTNMIQDSKSYEEAELKCIQAFIDAAKQNSND